MALLVTISLCCLVLLFVLTNIDVFGSPAKRKGENYRRYYDRLSGPMCNMSDGERLNCGFYGIDEDTCNYRECCWEESETPGVPVCFYSKPTINSMCLLDPEERIECGYYGIGMEECLAMTDCCWQPTDVDWAPWCYKYRRDPVFVGECGVPYNRPEVHSRIVGGDEAKPHSWPWMVSWQQDEGHHCGGSILNKHWVVSAAHCYHDPRAQSLHEAVVGIHSLEEPNQQRIGVETFIPHPNYTDDPANINDIMLLKLKQPLLFNANVIPVCLPEVDYELAEGRRCYTSGWGDLSGMKDYPDRLQQVMVPILSINKCNERKWYNGLIDETMVCGGYEEGGRDSCQGDSGGPLVCNEDDHWTLMGIVSWGKGCAVTRKPGLYAKVSSQIKWIEKTIAENQ